MKDRLNKEGFARRRPASRTLSQRLGDASPSLLRIALAFLFLLAVSVNAIVPSIPLLIGYQGRIVVGTTNFEGTGQFKFALVNAAGTLSYWNNDGTSAGPPDEPATAVSLPVSKGLYSVLLGDTTLANMAVILPNAGVFSSPDLRLRVWFDDGIHGFQLLAPDQRLAPASYLADKAVRASTIEDQAIVSAKIGPGAINGPHIAAGSLDFGHLTVPAAPGAGEVLGFDGSSLIWTAPGNAGSIWSLNPPSDAYYNAGKVGIGTSTPQHRLSIAGGPLWTSNNWKGAIELENGAAIGWQANTLGRRFGIGHSDGGFGIFHTVSNPGTTGSPALYDLFIADNGNNVGIGTSTPASKLTVQTATGGSINNYYGIEHTDGAVRLATFIDGSSGQFGTRSNHPLEFFTGNGNPSLTINPNGNVIMSGGSAGTVSVATPNGESGLTIQRNSNRADVRFDGATLKLVAGPGSGPPPSTEGVAINTSGNVGIGTTSPAAKLQVVADGLGGTGILGTGSGFGVGVKGQNSVGPAIYAEGHAGQTREKGGFAKAMLFVRADGVIMRGYNSFLSGDGATTPPCGFSVEVIHLGFDNSIIGYVIDFGFRIDDRFVSVTPSPGGMMYGNTPTGPNQNKLWLNPFNNDFTVIVY